MSVQYEDGYDNVYVNVNMTHNPVQGVRDTPAEYKVTKTIPILGKSSDYYLSVIKFDIPLNTLPLYIMPIVPPFPNITPFVIGITDTSTNTNYSGTVTYISEDQSVPIPIQNLPTQIVTPYYFCFSYETLIEIVNDALDAAFVLSGLPGDAPYFEYDGRTGLISITVGAEFLPGGNGEIYMNSYLREYLGAFKATFLGFSQPDDRDFVLNFDKTNVPFTPPVTFYQEYSTVATWPGVRKILITSNSIPVVSEYTPSTNGDVSSTFRIITDFTPAIELPGQQRSIAYFTPNGQYRLVDLISNIQLNTIDLKILWEDTQNNIFPLTLAQGQQANIKLGFFKKSLYKNSKNTLKV